MKVCHRKESLIKDKENEHNCPNSLANKIVFSLNEMQFQKACLHQKVNRHEPMFHRKMVVQKVQYHQEEQEMERKLLRCQKERNQQNEILFHEI